MKKIQKRLAFLGLMTVLILAAWAVPQAAFAQGTVAVVDTRRAVAECSAGKRAQVELRKRADKLQTELKALGAEVEALRKDLENTAMLLKPEAKLAKERDFERKARLFNDRKRDAQQEMMEAERDHLTPIVREMGKVIQELGAKSNYAVVMEAASALYYPKSADITAQVIAAYDKLHP